jgi:hypothetical protein
MCGRVRVRPQVFQAFQAVRVVGLINCKSWQCMLSTRGFLGYTSKFCTARWVLTALHARSALHEGQGVLLD